MNSWNHDQMNNEKINLWNDKNIEHIRTYIISQRKHKLRNTVHIRCVLIKYDRKSSQIPISVNMYAEKFLQHFSFQLEQFCTRLRNSDSISYVKQEAITEESTILCLKKIYQKPPRYLSYLLIKIIILTLWICIFLLQCQNK